MSLGQAADLNKYSSQKGKKTIYVALKAYETAKDTGSVFSTGVTLVTGVFGIAIGAAISGLISFAKRKKDSSPAEV